MVQKIIIALVFLIVFNWIYPCIPIYATDDEETTEEAPWGVLLEPLLGLISGLGEGVIWLIQSNLLGISPASVYIDVGGDDGIWEFVGGLFGTGGGAAAAALGVAFTLGTGGVGFVIGAAAAVAGGAIGHAIGNWAGGAIEDMFSDDFYLPLYAISPAEIFSNQIPALDINFINPSTDATQEVEGEDGETRTIYNSAAFLSPQISKWYVALRNFVLIGLMVVLLYIGIRIVISSTAGEKAKYKEHIKDWLVAVILVIFMHYIMAFAITLTQYVTSMLSKSNEVVAFPLAEDTVNAVEEAAGVEIEQNSDGNYYYYTNLMGYARLMAQANAGDDGQFSWNSIGYTIVFLVLVIYTVMFLIIYLKRVIYMAFLTMIAPLVALTYPIDKISDGQAQAFNMWLKEYVYNLLLQPFHLLLYTMLVGSVMDLAINNMIYALVALGFLIPAERLLRRFFGFDQKAPETGSIVGGVVGGSMAMSAINSLRRIGSVPQRGNGRKEIASGNNENDNGKTRLANRKPDSDKKTSIEDLLVGENSEEGESTSPSNSDSDATIRTAVPPIINPSVANAENGTIAERGVNLQDNLENAPEPFNPNSDYEYLDMKPLNINDKKNDAKDWITNLKPIRGVTDGARGIMDKVSNELNKKPLGRDIKRLTIRGGRTLKAVGGTAAHFTGKALSEVGKRAPRLMTKAALGATLGTAGVAAGIASGDWSNIPTYGAAAVGVGISAGEGVSNVAGNIGNGAQNITKGVKDDYESRRYTKEERENRQNKKIDEEWKKDKNVIRMYKDEFGKEYKKAMQQAEEHYRPYGITNDKATIKNIKEVGLENRPSNVDIAKTRIASSVSTETELKDVTARLRNNHVSEDKIKNIEDSVRKYNISGNFV